MSERSKSCFRLLVLYFHGFVFFFFHRIGKEHQETGKEWVQQAARGHRLESKVRGQQPHGLYTTASPFFICIIYSFIYQTDSWERKQKKSMREGEWHAAKGHRLDSNPGCCCKDTAADTNSIPLLPFLLKKLHYLFICLSWQLREKIMCTRLMDLTWNVLNWGVPVGHVVEHASHAQRPCPQYSSPAIQSELWPFAACHAFSLSPPFLSLFSCSVQ